MLKITYVKKFALFHYSRYFYLNNLKIALNQSLICSSITFKLGKRFTFFMKKAFNV